MSKHLAACVAGLILAAAQPAAAASVPELDTIAENVKAHMAFLASDLLSGREAGSPGYDIAAEYVASEFRQLGLKPAGDTGTFFQKVPLVGYRPSAEGTLSLKGADGRAVPLAFGTEFLPSRAPVAGPLNVSAPLVFAGFGVVAPEKGRDDFAGLDLKGKVVVLLGGAPAAFQTEERAYYASARNKRAEAAKRGAVGVVFVDLPSDEKRRPFEASRRSWDSWSMTWRTPEGQPFDAAPTAPTLASISSAAGPRLFAGAQASYEQVTAAVTASGDPPRFALPLSLDVKLANEVRTVDSRNVAAILPGSDPKLKEEVVVLSAHLDHVGVTRPVNGDSINNGALDNAAGIGTILEVARAFSGGKAPKRSILFLAVTAEEKGLLGAEYFARNPTSPLEKIIANVNLDMPILTYDFADVVAFGATRSSIGPAVERAARRMGVALSPDPMPEEGLFTRSDHFRFVEVGVPSVFLMTGFRNGGEAKFRGFLADCYHKPCDDLSQPIDYRAGAKFVRINYEIARELADARTRPLWNRGDFFGERFGRR